MSLKPLIIVGAGGFGREVAWLIKDINKQTPEWDLIGFVDDNAEGKTIEGYPILGTINSLTSICRSVWLAVAIGDPYVRKKISDELDLKGFKLATLIHPTVSMSEYVSIAAGCIICSGTIITTNVNMGKGCILNLGCFVGHDSVLGDFVSMMPAANLAGDVFIGTGCYFGLNSCVVNLTEIGEWSIVGAGATVTKNIPSHSLVVGVPARVIRKLS